MTKLICLAIAILCCFLAHSQYTYFNNLYLGNNTGTFQFSVIDSAGYYITMGAEEWGLSRRKYDNAGELVMYDATGFSTYNLGGGNNPHENLLKMPNGFISNYAYILDDCPNSTEYAGYAMFNNNLDTIWTKRYPEWSICDTMGVGMQAFCRVDTETSAMLSIMPYNNGHSAPVDSMAIRITTFENINGNIISDHFATRPYERFWMTQMRYIDGFFYILGDAVFEQTNPLDYQTLLVKVNSNAEIVAELELGNPNGGWEKWPQMEVTPENDIVLTYEYTSEYLIPKLNAHYQLTESHVAIIDVENFAVTIDSIYYLPYLENWVHGISKRCILIDSQHNFLIVDGVDYNAEDPPEPGQSQPHFNIITKLNPEFEVLWQNEYFSADFSNDYYDDNTNLLDLIQTSDGGYIATGVSYSECCQKHWLLKLDNCGYEQPSGCPAVISVEEQNEAIIQLWPNPFHNLLKAVIPQDAQRVFITDMTGRMVFEEKVYYPNQQWDLSFLSKGVYLFNAACEDGRVIGQKVVKQ